MALSKRSPKKRLDYLYDKIKNDGKCNPITQYYYEEALQKYLEDIGEVDVANKMADLLDNYFWVVPSGKELIKD